MITGPAGQSTGQMDMCWFSPSQTTTATEPSSHCTSMSDVYTPLETYRLYWLVMRSLETTWKKQQPSDILSVILFKMSLFLFIQSLVQDRPDNTRHLLTPIL